MAILQMSYHSEAMQREVTFNALIPMDTMKSPDRPPIGDKPMKSLYLLHGYSGSFTDWISYTNIRELCYKYHIAVFMPSGENNFYLDDVDRRALYGEYIGDELVKYTRELFPLSDCREDTFIGGLSMGGYGALRNGLKYAGNFGNIIALSSALITYKIENASPDYTDGIGDYKYFTSVFGDLTKLSDSDKDPEALLKDLIELHKPVPNIYMACGTEDFLLDVNKKYRDFVNTLGVNFKYEEAPGDHNWDFWNEYIDKGLAWLLEDK